MDKQNDPNTLVRAVQASSGLWTLEVCGGEDIAWDGRPWEPGKARALFAEERHALCFAEAHDLEMAQA